jgi:hypothetical protein
MDSTILLIGGAILVGWIMLTLLARERQYVLREQEAKEQAGAAAKPALPDPAAPAPSVAKKAA